MTSISYPAIFKSGPDGSPIVSFVDFHARTDGRDLADAMGEASDLLGGLISTLMLAKADVPKPSALKRGQRLVPVPLYVAPKLALYWAMRDQGISNVELARRLKIGENSVRRLLDPEHQSRAEALQQALEAAGVRLTISVEHARVA